MAGRKHTDQTRAKMRTTPRRKRGPMPQDVREKHAAALRGKTRSAETRRKLADANRIEGVTWMHGRASVYAPDHPAADHRGRVKRARIVAEGLVGRSLTRNDAVHHINIDPKDDDSSNLMVMSRTAHRRFHGLINRLGISDHFREWFSAAEREHATTVPSGGLQT